jgi:hypothetical protein
MKYGRQLVDYAGLRTGVSTHNAWRVMLVAGTLAPDGETPGEEGVCTRHVGIRWRVTSW